MRVLIVDDAVERHDGLSLEYSGHEIHHAYNYKQAVWRLAEEPPYDLICLDHDLGDFESRVERTGYTIACYMAEHEIKAGAIRVHSHNPVGARAITELCKRHGLAKTIAYQPFTIFQGAEMTGLKKEHSRVDLY